MKPFLFLDRDGTIVEDTGYLREASVVDLLPNAAEGLREIRAKGYQLFMVSNQSGVGRGIITDVQFREVHNRVVDCLKREGIELDGFGYCLHKPDDDCHCRKPRTGLVPKEWQGEKIDYAQCLVVGDRRADVDLACSLGATPWLVLTGVGRTTHDSLLQDPQGRTWSVCDHLADLAKKIPPMG
ncbi:MAG: HAD-IIIA family hydrolase [Deltaproteobacteria bacterium]|nr:HAD-IIIA family hydrolase [Deltaproteobacteria bacterium]MBI3294794.1 HAD-IIIA family hydrolase [Deltaproteobacteria bacterium]